MKVNEIRKGVKKDKKLKITENYSEKEVEGTDIVKIFHCLFSLFFWQHQKIETSKIVAMPCYISIKTSLLSFLYTFSQFLMIM